MLKKEKPHCLKDSLPVKLLIEFSFILELDDLLSTTLQEGANKYILWKSHG